MEAGRYIYTVFMCHLSVEKALKGLYVKKFKKNPPKKHNLIFFVS
uniref:HEPN domain-containing protein n=1 Tax=candidate division WOR-3 bacterium TaxID=2052148 RepID=A0A7C4YD27_UNCW3